MNEWDLKSFTWDLRPESVVVECGAFHGRWALEISSRYNPKMYLFEPQAWLTAELKQTFQGRPAKVYPFGLGTETKKTTLWEVGNDGATFVDGRDARDAGQLAEIREIKAAFDEIGMPPITLMLMNIEGGEYTLIPHMFKQGIFPKWFMVQMHLRWGNEQPLRAIIAEHYRLLWDYGTILTAWERREPNP
jgi:FkbM family methyltransferase